MSNTNLPGLASVRYFNFQFPLNVYTGINLIIDSQVVLNPPVGSQINSVNSTSYTPDNPGPVFSAETVARYSTDNGLTWSNFYDVFDSRDRMTDTIALSSTTNISTLVVEFYSSIRVVSGQFQTSGDMTARVYDVRVEGTYTPSSALVLSPYETSAGFLTDSAYTFGFTIFNGTDSMTLSDKAYASQNLSENMSDTTVSSTDSLSINLGSSPITVDVMAQQDSVYANMHGGQWQDSVAVVRYVQLVNNPSDNMDFGTDS